MTVFRIFRDSLGELRDVRCIAVTGVLIGFYIIIESLFSVELLYLKINFAFLALAAIGMYYGPVVGMLAAIPCDLIGAALKGNGLVFIFTFIAMFEGLVYGLFLYRYKIEKRRPSGNSAEADEKNGIFGFNGEWCGYLINNLRIVVGQTIVVVVSHLIFNTAVLYYLGFLGSGETLGAVIAARIVKNVLELPLDIILMFMVLIPLKIAYNRVSGLVTEREE